SGDHDARERAAGPARDPGHLGHTHPAERWYRGRERPHRRPRPGAQGRAFGQARGRAGSLIMGWRTERATAPAPQAGLAVSLRAGLRRARASVWEAESAP